MATATPNPVIAAIRGRIGGIVFYNRKNTTCIRAHVIPKNPDTEAQRIIRGTFADAVKSWHSITNDEREKYNRKSRKLNMSGYNLYISEYMKKRISAISNPVLKQKPVNLLYQYCIQSRISSISPSYPLRIPSVSPSYRRVSGEKTAQSGPG